MNNNLTRVFRRYNPFLCLLLVVISLSTFAESKEDYENLKHKDPVQERLRLRNEGVAHYESGIALKKAVKAFKQALERAPGSAIERFNLGVTYRKKNEVARAIELFESAIAAKKDFAHPYYSLGLIYKKEGKNKAALQAFNNALKYAPNEASVHYQISRIFREQGDTQKALQSIVNTLQLDRFHTGALYQFYLFHQQNGDKEEADRIFREFSRVKKAFGRTRVEINPDESILALPIDSNNEAMVSSRAAKNNPAKFTRRELSKNARYIRPVDFNGDGIPDLVIATRGDELIWKLNNEKLDLKEVERNKFNGTIHAFAVAPLIVGGSMQAVVATEKGIFSTYFEGEGKTRKIKKLSQQVTRSIDLVDIDHDGDLDIIADTFVTVLLNDGDGEFAQKDQYLTPSVTEEIKEMTHLLGSGFSNNTRADFIAYQKAGTRRLLKDEMGGNYSLEKDTFLSSLSDIQWVQVADMDNDGWTDIVTLQKQELTLDYNIAGETFKKFDSGKYATARAYQSGAIADFNNDGHKDIAVVSDTGNLSLWTNRGEKKYSFKELHNTHLEAGPATTLTDVDINNDGLVDIITIDVEGNLVAFINTLEDSLNWMKVDLIGNRSAPNGRFTQVEVRYGSFYSKYESRGQTLHIPLGANPYAEILRITWPNGFVENKFKVNGKNRWSFEESERISGSCPSIYTWDGSMFNYYTDAFISGPMGVPTAPGKYFPVDDDEYVKIPGELLETSTGYYKISLVEELKEVTYIDKVKLFAVDHPADTEIFPNEFLKPGIKPDFRLHSTRSKNTDGLQTIKWVRDHLGEDVTERVREIDSRYTANVRPNSYTGFADDHYIDIALTQEAQSAINFKLYLTGWFYYFDSTSLVSAAQNADMPLKWPLIKAWTGSDWITVENIGIPSGKDKTIVVDLSGKLPAGTRILRIESNFELYWDRVLVDTSTDPENSYQLSSLPLGSAKLRFHGFSQLVESEQDSPQPDRFDYYATTFDSFWDPLEGKYTRYGDVLDLLVQEDSQMAVFGSGDELVMEFNKKALPPLQEGWKRDFILYLNGYVKDGDKYTVHAGTVEPMPFEGMESYPFSPGDKQNSPVNDGGYETYLNKYQIRNPISFTRDQKM